MGRSSMCCSNWGLGYLGKKKVFEAKVRFDRRERCGWLVMSAMGKRWKSSGMNARHLPLLPDFYRFLVSPLSVLIILFTVKGSICTWIYSSVYCVPENDEGEKYLPSRSSQYTGRKKLKKINKLILFFRGQRIEHLILAWGAGPGCAERVILNDLSCYRSNRLGKGYLCLGTDGCSALGA